MLISHVCPAAILWLHQTLSGQESTSKLHEQSPMTTTSATLLLILNPNLWLYETLPTVN